VISLVVHHLADDRLRVDRVIPWSSQARGFFTPAATLDNRSNEEWLRVWFSPENFQRKARAEELARRKGVEPINIALAYVLYQRFPTFPIVGPNQAPVGDEINTGRARRRTDAGGSPLARPAHGMTGAFGYHAGVDSLRHAFTHALGGGGILDVGCYR